MFASPNLGGMLTPSDMEAIQRQSMMAAGAGMMDAGGWSPQRKTFGQAVGQGLKAGLGAQNDFLTARKNSSNIDEWVFYNKLSPADQDRYLDMKRTNSIINAGDTQVRVGQATGTPTLQVPVGAAPDIVVDPATTRAFAAGGTPGTPREGIPVAGAPPQGAGQPPALPPQVAVQPNVLLGGVGGPAAAAPRPPTGAGPTLTVTEGQPPAATRSKMASLASDVRNVEASITTHLDTIKRARALYAGVMKTGAAPSAAPGAADPGIAGWRQALYAVSAHLAPGTDAYDLADLVKTLSADNLVQSISVLRRAAESGATGLGQITEKEGDALRSMPATVNPASGEFLRNLDKIEAQLNLSLKNIRTGYADQVEAWKPQAATGGAPAAATPARAVRFEDLN